MHGCAPGKNLLVLLMEIAANTLQSFEPRERLHIMEMLRTDRPRPRLLIADDHAIFSDALRSYLEKNFDVVGQVPDGRALLSEAAKLKPDLVIVDVGMPVLNGIDAARRIKEITPKVKFIFLTMQDDPHLAAAALELGPVAFVLKHSAGSEFAQSDRRSHARSLLYSTEGEVERLGRSKGKSKNSSQRPYAKTKGHRPIVRRGSADERDRRAPESE